MSRNLLFKIRIAGEPEFEVYSDLCWTSKPLIDMDKNHLQNCANMILEAKYKGYNIHSESIVNGHTMKEWTCIFIARLRMMSENTVESHASISKIDLRVAGGGLKATIIFNFNNNQQNDIQADSQPVDRQQGGTGIRISSRGHKIAAGKLNSGNPHCAFKGTARIEPSRIQIPT